MLTALQLDMTLCSRAGLGWAGQGCRLVAILQCKYTLPAGSGGQGGEFIEHFTFLKLQSRTQVSCSSFIPSVIGLAAFP